MFRKAKPITAVAVALAPWLFAMPASADETFGVTSVITLPTTPQNTDPNGGLASLDHSFVDPVAGVYVLSDRTNFSIDVIDTATIRS